MGKVFAAFFIFGWVCAPSFVFAEEILVDKIVAVVNREPILYSQLQSKIRKGQPVIITEFPASETDPEESRALQDQINLELILQKVFELELDVEDSQVESEIQGFLKQRSLSQAGLIQALSDQGMSYEEYKEDFRQQMLIRKFQGRVISPLIKITDKDVENYYLRKVGTTSENVLFSLRKIHIKIEGDAIPAVAEGKKRRALEVYQKLKGGMEFTEAAKLYSDDPGADNGGGKMPMVKLEDLAENIKTHIKTLSKGEFTTPIETPAGYYIFFIDNKSFSGTNDFQRQKNQLEFELRNVELVSQTKKWLTEERRRSKVNLLN